MKKKSAKMTKALPKKHITEDMKRQKYIIKESEDIEHAAKELLKDDKKALKSKVKSNAKARKKK